MTRGMYLLGVGIVLVTLAFISTDWALGPRPGVSRANTLRILKGMTQKEVEEILGSPASFHIRLARGFPAFEMIVWEGEAGIAVIDTIRTDEYRWRVIGVSFFEGGAAERCVQAQPTTEPPRPSPRLARLVKSRILLKWEGPDGTVFVTFGNPLDAGSPTVVERVTFIRTINPTLLEHVRDWLAW